MSGKNGSRKARRKIIEIIQVRNYGDSGNNDSSGDGNKWLNYSYV